MKKVSFSDILADLSDAASARMRKKVPEWADVPGIEFPTRLATEQCSSSATARYKAALVSRICPDCRLLADLTGGLGVDSHAFSRVCGRVLYNEMDPELAAAAGRNFSRLGVSNISISNVEVTADTLPGLVAEGPDVIFLDPARRSGTGRKVFLLEDCSPDIAALRDGLLTAAPDILAKLSPMADIAMVCSRLGPSVREVHVLGADGVHAALDFRRSLDVPGYEKIDLRPDTRFIATMNYGYAGTRDLNEALTSRFAVLDMPIISEENLQKLISRRYPTINPKIRDQLVKLYGELERKAESAEISDSALDLRGLLDAVALMEQGLCSGDALEMCIVNKSFDAYERGLIRDVIAARVPSDLRREMVFET